jgi:hypothetical protein
MIDDCEIEYIAIDSNYICDSMLIEWLFVIWCHKGFRVTSPCDDNKLQCIYV